MNLLEVGLVTHTWQTKEVVEALVAASPTLHLSASVLRSVDKDLAFLLDRGAADVLVWEIDMAQSRTTDPLACWPGGIELPRTLIVLLNPWDEAQARTSLAAGASAALPSDASPRQIEAAIHAAASELTVTDRRIFTTDAQARDSASKREHLDEAERLTPRELAVLAMLAEGSGNKAIGAHLGISEHTVKFHVSSILAKLGANSRGAAITAAIRKGWLMV